MGVDKDLVEKFVESGVKRINCLQNKLSISYT
jgi:hypothetical protein